MRGVTKEDILTLDKVSVSPEFSMGSLSDFEGDRGVAIGQRLAFKLGLSVGDSLTLITARGKTTPFGVLPSKKSYTILYIFKVGMSHYDEGVVFMPLFEAQRFFNKNGGVDAVEVMVATPERLGGLSRGHPGRRWARGVDRRLAGEQPQPDWRAKDRADGDVLDPVVPDSDRIADHHRRYDYVGEGEGQGHRHSSHHGDEQRRRA